MESAHHIVIQTRVTGTKLFVTTLENLRNRGWKPNGDDRHITGLVLDAATRRPLDSSYLGWDGNGDEVWVSEDAYPASIQVVGRQQEETTPFRSSFLASISAARLTADLGANDSSDNRFRNLLNLTLTFQTSDIRRLNVAPLVFSDTR